MIGKTWRDDIINYFKNADRNIDIDVEVNETEVDDLKRKIDECDGKTVTVRTIVEEAGLGNNEGLIKHLEQLKNEGNLDSLQVSTVKDFIETKKFSDIGKNAHGLFGVSKAIKEYNALEGATEEAIKSQAKFREEMLKNNKNLGNYANKVDAGKASIVGYGFSLVGATAKTFALEAASIALNTALTMGVSLIIQGVVTAITHWINKAEEAREKFEELTSTIQENKEELASQKDWIDNNGKTYEKLAKGVDEYGHNISLTTDEFKEYQSMTQEIADMFPNMVKGYDDQNQAILRNKGSVEELTKAYKENAQAYYDDTITKGGELWETYKDNIKEQKTNIKSLDTFIKKGYTLYSGADAPLETYIDSLFDSLDEQTRKEMAKEIREKFKLNDSFVGSSANVKLEDLTPELQQKIKSAYSKLESTVNTESKKVTPILEAYAKTQGSGFDDLTDEAQAAINTFINNVDWNFLEKFEGKSDTEIGAWVQNNLINPLKDGIQGNEIPILFSSIFSIDQEDYQSYQEYVEAVLRKLKVLREQTDSDGKKVYTDDQINNMARNLGVGDNEINPTGENSSGEVSGMKLINEVKAKYPELESYILKLSEDGLRKLHGLTENEASNLKDMVKKYGTEAITSLSEEDFKIALGISPDSYSSFDELKKLIEDTKKESLVPFEEAWASLADDAKNKMLELAKAGKLTAEAFKDIDGSDEFLKKIGIAADEAVEKINKLVTRADQLNSLGGGIRSLSNNLGTKKENGNKQGVTSDVLAGMSDELKACTKEWTEYEKVMMDANSTYEECEEVTNKLAKAYINSGNYLAGLTEETQDAYISDLQAMGIMNAKEIVLDALAKKTNLLAAEEEWAKVTTKDLANVTWDEIQALGEENKWSETTRQAIARLAFEKQLFNANALDTSDSINNLVALARQCGLTGDAIAKLTNIQSLKAIYDDSLTSGKIKSTEALNAMKDQIDKAYSSLKDSVTNGDAYKSPKIKTPKISSVNSSNKNSSSSSSKSPKSSKDQAKETKTAIDWIARSLKVLQDKIDLTKAKFDNLFGYNRKKNNLLKQIEQQKTLIEQTTRAVKAYQKEADKALKKVGSKTITISTKKVTKATVSSGNDLIVTAKKQLGYKEYGNNGTKFGKAFGSQFAKWCQFFVSWVQKKSGLSSKQAYMGGSTSAGMQWYKNHKMFGYKGKYTPKANDTVYFKSAGRSHTGLVEKVKNGKIYTIEGNSGNKVKRRSYSLNDKTITGYGKTSKYFKGSTSSKTSTVKLSKEQINYIKQLVTNYNTSDKALIKSMLIKKYGEKQGEKINNYISAFDKLTDVKKELEEQTSALYKMESDLRDLKLEYNEKKRSYYEARYANVTTVTDKNRILDKEISVYNSDNQAQDDYLKNVKQDRTAQAKVAKTSVKKIKTTKTNSKKGITKALKKKIYALIKQRKKIPSSILKQVKKASADAYNDLVEYNNQLDRFKEVKLDVDTEKEKNTTNIREKKIEKQQNIQDEADANISKLEAQSEIARDEKGNATAKEKNKYLAEQVKWIKQSYNAQIQIAKLEGNLALVEELRAKKQKELLDNTIQQKQNLADEADAQINLYEAQADNVYTAKGKIELYEKELAPLKNQYDKLIEIAKLEGDATEAERLRVEYSEKVAENYKKQFDAISHELNNKNGLLGNGIEAIQSIIDLAEAKGTAISKDAYYLMTEYTQGKLANDQIAKAEMEEKLSTLEGDDWYTAMSDYTNLIKEINSEEQQLWEWQQKLNEIELKPFEKLADKIEFINDEFDFMLKVIQDGNDLFDADTGSITDAGLASFAVYFDQMELAQEAIKNHKDELAKLDEQYKAGKMSLDDYTKKSEELTRKIWDESEAFMGLKDTIIDMVKDGLDAQLSALDKMIDKYKKALSNEKDLYEYQKNIAKQTKNITTIEKQIAALSGDGSEEARAKIQKLKIQLEDAKDELRDTEYNKWYEDQTNMLDDMRDDIADAFDDIIKNHREEIINNLLPVIKASSSNELIQKYMTEFGYNPTSDMTSILSNQGSIGNTLDDIKDRIDTYLNDFTLFNGRMEILNDYLLRMMTEDNTTYGNGKEGNDQAKITTEEKDTSNSSTNQPQFDNTPIKAQDRLYEIMMAILNNSKKTDSDTPTSTSFGHDLNDYLNRNFGLALSENDEQYVYQLLRETLGLSPNYDEELTLTKAIQLGLFKDLPNLLKDKIEQTNLGISSDKFIDGGILAENMNQGFISAIPTTAIPTTVTKKTKEKARKYLNKLSFPQNEKDEKARTEFAKKYKSAARIKHQWNGKMFKDMSELVGLAKIFGVVPSSATTLTSAQDQQLYELLKQSGFSTGGIGRLVKRAGEDGLALVRNGEGFVMPEHVPPIKQLVEVTPKVNKIMEDVQKNIPNGNIAQTVDIGGIDIHLDGSNVVDPQSFMEALDNTQIRNKVAKMVGNQFGKSYMNTLSKF